MLPVELLLEVSSEVDELPTEVDAALDAEEVLSASTGAAASAKAVANAAVKGRGDMRVNRRVGMVVNGGCVVGEWGRLVVTGEAACCRSPLRVGQCAQACRGNSIVAMQRRPAA